LQQQNMSIHNFNQLQSYLLRQHNHLW